MSVDYFAKNGGWFPLNFCGADMYGALHETCSLPFTGSFTTKRVPYVASAEETLQMAEAISQKTDVEILNLFSQEDEDGNLIFWMWDGTPQEFVAQVRRWEHFMRVSGGYASDYSLEESANWISKDPDWSVSDDYWKKL